MNRSIEEEQRPTMGPDKLIEQVRGMEPLTLLFDGGAELVCAHDEPGQWKTCRTICSRYVDRRCRDCPIQDAIERLSFLEREAVPVLLAEIERLDKRCQEAEGDFEAYVKVDHLICDFCKKGVNNGGENDCAYCDFKWRGPQTAEQEDGHEKH